MKQRTPENSATTLQGKLAVVSLASGIIIACICLFLVPPPGEIANSAITVVSELLILSGALLGVKVSYDAKLQKMSTDVEARIEGKIAEAIKADREKRGIVPEGINPAEDEN